MPKPGRDWRRVAVWSAAAAAALLTAAYFHVANPARLRACVLRATKELFLDGVDFGEVALSPWGRLQITDVVVAPPAPSALYQCREGIGTPPLLRIQALTVQCGIGNLLLGRIRPDKVGVSGVTLALVCQAADREAATTPVQAEVPVRLLTECLARPYPRWPELTIQQADLEVYTVSRGRAQLLQRLLWQAAGRTTAAGYELRVERRPAGEKPLAELRWRSESGELTLAADWVELRTLGPLLPGKLSKQLELDGRVRLDRLVFQVAGQHKEPAQGGQPQQAEARLAELELRLADLRGALPLENERRQDPSESGPRRPGSCYLQFDNAAGGLSLRPGAAASPDPVALTLRGSLRGAPVDLRLTTTLGAIKRLWSSSTSSRDDNAAASGAGSIDDVLEAELDVTGLELPTAETYPAFVSSPELAGPIATVFRDYVPHGKVAIRLRVLPEGSRGSGGQPLHGAGRLAGEIEPLAASCRYVHFPYQFEEVTGVIRLSEGQVRLDKIAGRHAGAWACASGVLNSTRSWTGFELVFQGRGVALDGELYAALPAGFRRLWQVAAPLGLCDVVATVRRAEGSDRLGVQPTSVQVQARLLGGSLSLGAGRRLEHADGWLVIRDGEVQIEDLYGYESDSIVRLEGRVHVSGESMQSDLHVEVGDLPLVQEVRLPPALEGQAPPLRFVGRGDVRGQLRSGGPRAGEAATQPQRGSAHQQQLAVRIRRGEITGLRMPRGWTVTDGLVTVQDARRQIVSLDCTQGDHRVAVSGVLPAERTPAAALEVSLHAATSHIENLYTQFLPTDWTSFVDGFGLNGQAELAVQLRPSGDELSQAEQLAEVELHAARMKPQALPVELQSVSAKLLLAPGRCRVAQASGRWGASGQVTVTQAGFGTWQAGNAAAEFAVRAEKLAFTPELVAALPEKLAQALQRLAVRGEFDVALDRVRLDLDRPAAGQGLAGSEERTWRLEGRMPVRNASLRLGLDLTGVDGELSGVGTVGPAGALELDAGFAIARGELAGRPIEHWEGRLVHVPDGRWIHLENVWGRICEGVAEGSLRIDPTGLDYELALCLHDVRLAGLLPPPKQQSQSPRPGRVDGEVWLRGRGGDAGSRRGGGTVRITGASFAHTPVLASVFQQRQKAGLSDTVDQAQVRFRWEGRQVYLERVDIRSRDLRLLGEGSWELGTDRLHLTLWAAHPDRWPRLAGVSELLESVGGELVQYRVEGTLGEPRVTAEPLPRLSEALRRFLGEGQSP